VEVKKGYTILLDGIVALTFTLIILAGLLGLRENTSASMESSMKILHYASQDVLDVLNKKGVLDEVGELWAASDGNRSSPHFMNASEISRGHIELLLPENVGYLLTIDGDPIANRSAQHMGEAGSLTHSSRLLVGYGRGLPTRGFVSRAFLTNVKEKETSSYAYFGGYVGQGNITVYLRDIPPDATVNRCCLELNSPSAFELRINGQYAGEFNPVGGDMSANLHEPGTGCIASEHLSKIMPGGVNQFQILFTEGDLMGHYIGGGYVHARYNSTEMDTDEVSKTLIHYLPGIDGIINLYDSFYVPGAINSMSAHLHFKSNYSMFFNVGGTTVYNMSGNESQQTVTLDNSHFTGAGFYFLPVDDARSLSQKTVPIRIGSGDISSTVVSGNADVILITDMSGSMLRCLDSNSPCGVDSDCPGSRCRWPYSKELNKIFIENILNHSGNRVGLVTFSYNALNRHSLSSDGEALNATVEALANPSGGTCICCAIRMARNMLSEQSTVDRDKYIIVMTDGIANIRCHPTDENRTSCCSQGYCASPTCGVGLYWSPECNDYVDDTAILRAVEDAEKSHMWLGATVNVIGFGAEAIDCDLALNALDDISRQGNGTYCASSDEGGLLNCYLDFATQIYTSSLQSQTVYFGGELTDSILYPDSYIRFEYEPLEELSYGEISLKRATGRFEDTVDCAGWLHVPQGAVVSDAKVTSYSGEHWTDRVLVNSEGVYDLSGWGGEYVMMGDPFIVDIPAYLMVSGGNNSIIVATGDNQTHYSGCSPDNRAIYTLRIQTLIGYGQVFGKSQGCDWTIEFSDGTVYNTVIPAGYDGDSECEYSSDRIVHDGDDALSDAVHRLLSHLDIDGDGRVDLLFDFDMIGFETSQAGGVQSLWGPAKFKLIVWI
jgi:hypothetical protein